MISNAHDKPCPDDVQTLGGRVKRVTVRIPIESGEDDTAGPHERPTSPVLDCSPTVRPALPSPDLPPPSPAEALDMARRFLSGSVEQSILGRDGAEALARRVIADHQPGGLVDRAHQMALGARRPCG